MQLYLWNLVEYINLKDCSRLGEVAGQRSSKNERAKERAKERGKERERDSAKYR